MNLRIATLLSQATEEALDNGGVVSAATAMDLAEEGYDLTYLDREVEARLAARIAA